MHRKKTTVEEHTRVSCWWVSLAHKSRISFHTGVQFLLFHCYHPVGRPKITIRNTTWLLFVMLQPYNKRVPVGLESSVCIHCYSRITVTTFTFTLLPALWSRLNKRKILCMPSLLGLVQIYKQFSHIVNTSLSLLWRATEHVSDLNDLQVCASGKIRALFLVCVLKRTHTTSLKCKCEVVAYCTNLPDSNKSSSCVMGLTAEAETLSELSTLSHQLIVLLTEQKVSLQLVVCLFWDHLNLSHEVTFFQWNRDLFVYAKPVWTSFCSLCLLLSDGRTNSDRGGPASDSDQQPVGY